MTTDQKQITAPNCPNCNGHLASIGQDLRECEDCGKIQKENKTCLGC
jgi:tRNA(Ile2) C34 agmatinyltransferase TiaS